ncbi:MAG TPA: hypothetical protein PKG86_07425 [Bacteroidales bacterium]|nr:hypothetical protein [Bacteroidales bacterium]
MKFLRKSLLILFLLFYLIKLQAVEVTFRVDMSNETVSPNGVFIAGTFNGWNATSDPLVEPIIGNVYTIVLEIPAGTNIEYKFLNGDVWENFSGPCTLLPDNNRFYFVPEFDVTLPVVCFSSCNVCNPPQVFITFQVDMSQQNVAPDGVFLAGTFNGWTNNNPMVLLGNDIYKLTLPLGSGDYHQYKFKNGANGWETVPGTCSQNGNRFIVIPSVSTTLDAVCFGSCYPCGPPPVPVNVTFQVDMSLENVSPEGVHIAGGFQGWDPGATLMTSTGNGIFTYTTTLNSGTYQEYKFINGATWEGSEWVPEECANGANRYFIVPQTDVTLEAVCYGACEECPEPVLPQVTFQVDMSEQNVSPEGVYLVVQNGNPSLNELEHIGNNIFTVTLPFEENQIVNYKFSNGIKVSNYEQIPEACRIGNPFTGYWRTTTVPGYDVTLPEVCFGKCTPCIPVFVTFKVDLSNEEISEDGIHIAGSFQGWNAETTPMTDIGNNIFEITLMFSADQYIEFKYINGISFDFAESVPQECGVDDTFGGFNRFFIVPEEDVILDVVCFGACEACIVPMEVEVVFKVDLSNEEISPDGVHIAGSFQGWSTIDTEMIPQGNKIFYYTTYLLAGYYYEYKFINGIDWEGAEIIPAECSSIDGNRFLTVPEGGVELDLVCFSGCDVCPTFVPVVFKVDMSKEEVSPDGVHLTGDFQGWNPAATPMTNLGNGVYSTEVLLPELSYQTYRFINGNSFESGLENVPEDCGVDDGFGGMKRYMTVPEGGITLDLVCFGLCNPCPESHNIAIQKGWSGLSSFVMPENNNIEEMLDEIFPELIVIQNMTGFYYPAGNINTIETWDSQSAYQIKVVEDVTLTVIGYYEEDKTLFLSEGWNLIPVISAEPVAVADLFNDVYNHLILVKEVAGTDIFWPIYSINSISHLQPGKAYFVKMSVSGNIVFP